MSDNKPPSLFDLFKIVLETRNFEIELLWKRSNYFLVLNTAIAVGFFSLGDDSVWYKLFISLFGALVSVLWLRVNLGSKYWQVKWEQELKEMQKQMLGSACECKSAQFDVTADNARPSSATDKGQSVCNYMENIKMFDNDFEKIDKQVKENLSPSGNTTSAQTDANENEGIIMRMHHKFDQWEAYLKPRIYKCVLSRPSVSFTMTCLSLLFVAGWLLLSAITSVQLLLCLFA